MEYYNALLKRRNSPIKVGIVGAGQMGEGLVCQMELMNGMRGVAVADIVPERAKNALLSAKILPANIVETNDAAKAAQAISDGKCVATQDPGILCQISELDIVVEATGVPEVGAQIALNSILNRQHVLQMNVETDATVGYILRKMARSAGIVYTLTAGDEPGSTMELFDFAKTLGFTVVSAGKGKNNPLDRTATPDTMAEKAKKQMMNPKMLTSFVDGTKTMVEMTSFGNAVGFVPDIRGMHGPEVTSKNLAQVYCPKEDGGILSQTGVVEYGLGVAPGVFAVFTTDHPKIARDLQYLHMGPGPYWAIYRPYHLTSLETPISILRAVLKNETSIATDIKPVAETITVAKKDLKAGDTIDTLGGFTVYGMIERADVADREDLLPLGLAPGCVMKKDVPAGHPVSYSDVQLKEGTTILQLRRLQDKDLGRRVR